MSGGGRCGRPSAASAAGRVALRPPPADRRGRAVFCATPKAFTFLYELYQLGQNPTLDTKGIWKSWQFPTITSPFIPQAEIDAARADMDERSFRQEFEATFESMSGRAYYNFDPRTHLGKYNFNPHLPIWVGQDFNINPMSTVVPQPQAT